MFRKLPSGNEVWGRGIPTNPKTPQAGEQDDEILSEMKVGTKAKRPHKALIYLRDIPRVRTSSHSIIKVLN